TSEYVTARVPVRVVQYAEAILPNRDRLNFTSLGAEQSVLYQVHDDRGRLIADTTATVAIADTSVALFAGGAVRAVRPGETRLQLSVGSVNQTVLIDVQQRVASLRLQRDTIRFDALRDTTTIHAIAQDSLGYPVLNPDLVFEVGNGEVAQLSADRSLESLTP